MELAGATWRQVEATGARTVLAVPLGSLEQHGPHLPLDTDSRIAGAVAAGLAARCEGVTVAPAVPYGASGEHADFPGTLLVGHEVLAGLLVELVRSARRSFAGVVFVNGHGGNEEALVMVERRAAAEGDDVLVWRAMTKGGTPTPAGPRRRCCWPSHPMRCDSIWPSRAASSRSPPCCPVCAPKGCDRYRPTACWVIPRVRVPKRDRCSSTPSCVT